MVLLTSLDRGRVYPLTGLNGSAITVFTQAQTLPPFDFLIGPNRTQDRVVDLDALSVKVHRAWQKKQAAEREEWGTAYVDLEDDGGPLNLVFTRENGAPLDPGQTYLTFVKLVADAGLSHLKLHGLRHLNNLAPVGCWGLGDDHCHARRPHLTDLDPVDVRPPHRYRWPTSR